RHERHLGLLATRRADRCVHLARAAAVAAAPAAAVAIALAVAAPAAGAAPTAGRLALLAAGRTARRLIGEALLRVELLLPSRKHEIGPTILTGDGLVCVAHRSPPPLVQLGTVPLVWQTLSG